MDRENGTRNQPKPWVALRSPLMLGSLGRSGDGGGGED